MAIGEGQVRKNKKYTIVQIQFNKLYTICQIFYKPPTSINPIATIQSLSKIVLKSFHFLQYRFL